MDKRRLAFVCGGVQKGGTTALHTYLEKHPNIEMPQKKELHFFDHPLNFEVDQTVKAEALRSYHNNFSWKKTIQGEVTPVYIYLPECVLRIRLYNPEMKWILLLRNPIDRAYSHYNMHKNGVVNVRKERVAFSDIIRNELVYRRNSPLRNQNYHFSQKYAYLDRGRYSQQIRNLYTFFSEDQVLIIESDQLNNQPKEALDKIAQFLGLNPFDSVGELKKAKGAYKIPPMSDSDRDFLKDYYFHDITELEKLTNMSFRHWLE